MVAFHKEFGVSPTITAQSIFRNKISETRRFCWTSLFLAGLEILTSQQACEIFTLKSCSEAARRKDRVLQKWKNGRPRPLLFVLSRQRQKDGQGRPSHYGELRFGVWSSGFTKRSHLV